MSIRVHNSDYFEELRQSAIRESSSPSSKRTSSSNGRRSLESAMGSASPVGSGSRSIASELLRETQQKRVALKHELYEREQEALQKKLAESVAENLQRAKTKKEGQYLKLWKDVEDGRELADELQAKISLQDQSRSRQAQRMHDEWHTDVFQKLNEPIARQVEAMNAQALTQHKHDAHQKFLDITNKKGGLFRDIIIESEYNPLSDLRCLSYHTPVDDPTQRVIRSRQQENAIAGQGSKGGTGGNADGRGDEPTLGRTDNLDVKLWSQGVFESTPYGYFHKMLESRPNAEGSKTYASRVKLDHYDVDVGAEAVQRELPRGKRTDFTGRDVKVPQTTIQLF